METRQSSTIHKTSPILLDSSPFYTVSILMLVIYFWHVKVESIASWHQYSSGLPEEADYQRLLSSNASAKVRINNIYALSKHLDEVCIHKHVEPAFVDWFLAVEN